MLFAVLLALTPVTLTFWDVVIVMEVLPLLNCAEPLPCVVDRLSVIDEVFEAGETVTEYTSEPRLVTPRGRGTGRWVSRLAFRLRPCRNTRIPRIRSRPRCQG